MDHITTSQREMIEGSGDNAREGQRTLNLINDELFFGRGTNAFHLWHSESGAFFGLEVCPQGEKPGDLELPGLAGLENA